MGLSRELLYIIRAKDEATKTFEAVRQAINRVDTSSDKAGKTIGVAFGLLTREAGQAMLDLGSNVTRSVGSFVEAGRESIQVGKALDAVLRSTKGAAGLTAQELTHLADSLAQVTNFEDETVLRGENMLLTFTRIGKDVFPQATEAMLNISTAMRTDVQDAAIQLGKALNDPIEGIDALTRVGVRFTDEQKEMIKQMVEAGNTAGAQKVILAELETEFGGLARATADAGTQLSKSFNEIKEQIGKTLLPAFDAAAKTLIPVLQNVQKWIQENPELVKTIGIVAVTVGGLLTILGTLIVTVGSVAASLAALGITLAAGGALAVAIIGIGTLIGVVTQHWEGLKWMAGNAVDFIIEKANALLGVLGQVLQKIGEIIDRFNVFKQIQSAKELATFQVKDYAGPALKARAGGGRVDEPFTLVGERGPELVSLPRGSYVHPAGQTDRMLTKPASSVSLQIGDIHVHNEADEDRLIAKITRLVQLQTLQAA